MTKRQYLNLCLNQSTDWLKACAMNPSPYMRDIHIKLVLIAIRRKSHV